MEGQTFLGKKFMGKLFLMGGLMIRSCKGGGGSVMGGDS